MGKQVSINEFVLDLSAGEATLIGGCCQACGNVTFPRLSGCPKCAGTEIEPQRLSRKGTLWGWTVQGFPPKSPPYLGPNDSKNFKPFGVGYVELEEVIVEARLTEAKAENLSEGMSMELTLEALFQDDEGNDVVTFAFQPEEK